MQGREVVLGCKEHADEGYDPPRNQAALGEAKGHEPIARRDVDDGGPGLPRCKVERILNL